MTFPSSIVCLCLLLTVISTVFGPNTVSDNFVGRFPEIMNGVENDFTPCCLPDSSRNVRIAHFTNRSPLEFHEASVKFSCDSDAASSNRYDTVSYRAFT